tara:strand:+ start:691 stop:2661 length:1971 start_codon:yes stop_codon:yes gene_type:complete
MIILQKIKSNNKLIDLYFKIQKTSNELNIDIATDQNYNDDYSIEIPCVNIDNAIYFMKINFPLKFEIITFQKKKYIINHRIIEIMFKSQNIILDFLYSFINKLNLNIPPLKFLDNDKFIEILFKKFNKNTEFTDKEYYFFLNKSLLILYKFENYTNKIIKTSEFNEYISKKELTLTNNYKNLKIIFKTSSDFSIENHLKIINNKFKLLIPNKYFISNKNKFRKTTINKINLNTIEIIENTNKIILDKNIIKISIYPPNLSEICKKNDFFSYLISKHSNFKEKIYNSMIKTSSELIVITDIYEHLKNKFKNYTFPIKYTRRCLEETFEEIILFSIKNIDKLLITIDSKLYLHSDIISEVPNKVKTLYFNILKIFYQSRENCFDCIFYNTKLYLDNIHFKVLKIICEEKSTLNELDNSFNLQKIIYNFSLINKLRYASSIITWKNIPKKINIFKLLLNNKNIIFYNDRVNKNILNDTCDNRLKKIINEPLEMFKFLKLDKDYIKWIETIDTYIINLYYNQFNILPEKYNVLGKMLYLINNIEEQSFSNKKYVELINLAKNNKNLILEDYRINLKIKEFLNNNNINLGYLAKHINSSYNESTSFSNEENNIDILKKQLIDINNKYYKYKNKYHKLKTLHNTETNYDSSIDIKYSTKLKI